MLGDWGTDSTKNENKIVAQILVHCAMVLVDGPRWSQEVPVKENRKKKLYFQESPKVRERLV